MSSLVDIYMNHKINHLLNCALLITGDDEFLRYCFKTYFGIYLNSYYYHQFETVDSNYCDLSIINEELDGKSFELLDDLSCNELEESNESYLLKRSYITDSKNLSLCLINLDINNFFSGEGFVDNINAFIDNNVVMKEFVGQKRDKLISLINKRNNLMDSFFYNMDYHYRLEYLVFRDKSSFVDVKLYYDIDNLMDKYKKSLINRVYFSDKLDKLKTITLISKFIKRLLFDVGLQKKLYDRYFIELPISIYDKKDTLVEVLDMLDNPLIKRYVCITIKPDVYLANIKTLEKYDICFAAVKDFSEIEDINEELLQLDSSNYYSYILVDGYKSKDYEWFIKYSFNNVLDILFVKEG